MANIEKNKTYAGKSPTACFQAAVKAYPQAGFNIWKKRDIAWLVLAKCSEGGGEVNSNFSARPGNPTPVILTLSADHLSEEQLNQMAEKFFSAFDKELG